MIFTIGEEVVRVWAKAVRFLTLPTELHASLNRSKLEPSTLDRDKRDEPLETSSTNHPSKKARSLDGVLHPAAMTKQERIVIVGEVTRNSTL